MVAHETACFMNPNRSFCPVCFHGDTLPIRNPKFLDLALEQDGMEGLAKDADECPACIAATVARHNAKEKDSTEKIWYDYKSAMDEYRKNNREAREDHQSQMNDEMLRGLNLMDGTPSSLSELAGIACRGMIENLPVERKDDREICPECECPIDQDGCGCNPPDA